MSSALDGQIYIWNAIDANLLGTIEGRRDVMGGRKKSDRTKLASQVMMMMMEMMMMMMMIVTMTMTMAVILFFQPYFSSCLS